MFDKSIISIHDCVCGSIDCIVILSQVDHVGSLNVFDKSIILYMTVCIGSMS